MLLIEDKDDSEVFMSPPSSDIPHQVERQEVQYGNLSQKYILWDTKAASQYYKIYAARLKNLLSKVNASAKKLWPEAQVKKLCELQNYKERCIIIGTMFKKQELKPSILKDLSEENHLLPQPVLENFSSDNDEITLEDDLQRIQLVGNINPSEFVNGIICAALGQQNIAGKFEIEQIGFAGLPEPIQRTVTETDKHLILTSGIDLSSSADRFRLELLIDYIVGHLGSPSEQTAASQISRVIIAGNLIRANKGETAQDKSRLIQEADEFLSQLAAKCPIDVMPGEFDPSNYLLPQQPLHHCFFPKAAQYSTINSVTNPYQCEIGGRILMGTSGQNVRNISQCSSIADSNDVLKKICDWGHIAPTAPDTLVSYPFDETDPFIIDTRPDILFAGNQDKFALSVIHEDTHPVLLVSVPRFSQQGVCVLVNLKTLQCSPMHFSAPDCE